MALRIDGGDPSPSRSLSAVMAALHFVLVGMLLYFRLGPMARVFDRFGESETPLPGWFILGLTLGTLVVAAFLSWRGFRFLRSALKSPPSEE